jgi:hypothetical protein
VHHIEEQNTADAVGRLPSGQHKDHVRNLIVLCETCHDLHHAGKIAVGPIKQTSSGPVRIIEDIEQEQEQEPAQQESHRSSKWNSGQIQIIKGYLTKYPMCPPKRLVLDLREKEGIHISVASLKAFRS